MIGADGLIKDLYVISGPEVLRANFLNAVKQWTYKPYLLDGVAVPVETTINLDVQTGAASGQRK